MTGKPHLPPFLFPLLHLGGEPSPEPSTTSAPDGSRRLDFMVLLLATSVTQLPQWLYRPREHHPDTCLLTVVPTPPLSPLSLSLGLLGGTEHWASPDSPAPSRRPLGPDSMLSNVPDLSDSPSADIVANLNSPTVEATLLPTASSWVRPTPPRLLSLEASSADPQVWVPALLHPSSRGQTEGLRALGLCLPKGHALGPCLRRLLPSQSRLGLLPLGFGPRLLPPRPLPSRTAAPSASARTAAPLASAPDCCPLGLGSNCCPLASTPVSFGGSLHAFRLSLGQACVLGPMASFFA